MTRRTPELALKILITAHTFWPNSDGVATVTLQHALGFLKLGHQVVVATAFHPMRGTPPWPGLTIEQFRVSGCANLLFGISGEIREYRDFLAAFDGEIIFFHAWQAWSTDLALPRLHNFKPKCILVSHGVSANTWIGGPMAVPLWLGWRPYVWNHMRRAMRRFDAVIFLSNRADNDRFYDGRLARLGYARRTIVIPNGADLDALHGSLPSFRERYGLGDTLLILCVGKYSRQKNERMVAKAVIASGIANATLVVVGPVMNQYCENLERMWVSNDRRGNNLCCLRGLSREDILSAYKDADIYVNGSRTECFPLVVLDAMASATPFVSTPVGCVPDLPGGLIATSVRQMAQCLARLAASRALRQTLGAEGRAACERDYNWPDILSQYDQLIREVTT